MNRLVALFIAAVVLGAAPAQAACWQWTKTAGPNATSDPSINWSEGMSPSSVNDSARALMARLAECRDDLSGALISAGTSTAYTVTTNQGLNATPVDGQQIVVHFHTINGASATLAADGGTAFPIQYIPGGAVPATTLQTTVYRLTFYSAASAWLLQDFYNAPIGANAVTYAKIQQVAASRLLGNATGSLANVAEIPLGANMSFVGGALVSSTDPTAILGFISGLQLGAAGGSASFSIASGVATDTAGGGSLVLGSAYTKTTSAWAVGSGNGGLDNSTIAVSTWYHAFIIKRPDTGVSDICFGTNPTTGCAAGVGNIPAAYTLKRRIGSMKTDGASQWTAFSQNGDTFIWAAPVSDVTSAGLTTASRTNTALTVPTNIIVSALFRATAHPGSSLRIILTSLLENDVAVTDQNTDLFPGAPTGAQSGSFERLVNTSAQIGVRSDTLSGGGSLWISTYGWKDLRGKN